MSRLKCNSGRLIVCAMWKSSIVLIKEVRSILLILYGKFVQKIPKKVQKWDRNFQFCRSILSKRLYSICEKIPKTCQKTQNDQKIGPQFS